MTDPIRVGDEFEIKVKVLDLNDNGTRARVNWTMDEQSWMWVGNSVLLAGRRIARQLQVGDRVKTKDWDVVFEIIAIHKLWAWLKDPEDSLTQMALCNLELAP